MTRMTGPDCAVMCNLINTHTHTQAHTYTSHKHERRPYSAILYPTSFTFEGSGVPAESRGNEEESCGWIHVRFQPKVRSLKVTPG